MLLGKKYNLASKSDMRRFERDMKDLVHDKAVNIASNHIYTVECPFCHNEIHSAPGKIRCMKCGKIVDLRVNINI